MGGGSREEDYRKTQAETTTDAPKMDGKRKEYASQVDPPELEHAIIKMHAMQSMHSARTRRIMIAQALRDLHAAGHQRGYRDGFEMGMMSAALEEKRRFERARKIDENMQGLRDDIAEIRDGVTDADSEMQIGIAPSDSESSSIATSDINPGGGDFAGGGATADYSGDSNSGADTST